MLGYEKAKRAFDVALSAGTLAVLAPALIVIAAGVKLDSAGPVFYRGVRTGRNSVPFRIFKFRTMCTDAEVLGTTTRVDDPRVTRLGRFLRAYKLDELPQFLNVLRGDMSVVGPRPEVEEHTAAYDQNERRILEVQPGITDFASIRFADLASELGTVDPHREYVTRVRAEKNRLRLQYVQSRSMTTDVTIIARTVGVIASKALRALRRHG